MIYLSVAVPVPLFHTLTYSIDEETTVHDVQSADDLVGKRVLVPLGARFVTGYVLGESEDVNSDYKVKSIIDVLDRIPLFHSNIIPFFKWVSKYYHHPLGEVVKTAIPGGLSPKSTKYLELTDSGAEKLLKWDDLGELNPREIDKPSWYEKFLVKGTVEGAVTRKIFRNNSMLSLVNLWKKHGLVDIKTKITGGVVKEKIEICYELNLEVNLTSKDVFPPKEDIQQLRQYIYDQKGLDLKFSETKTLASLAWLGKSVPSRELRKFYPGAGKTIPDLIEKKIIREISKRVFRDPFGEQLEFVPPPKKLMPSQKKVLGKIYNSIDEGKNKTFLLHGVTGSGKTEVYMRATDKALNSGRGVLVLVPEIALATQLENQFISRFGDKVVLLHSALSAGEKYDQWSLAYTGKAKIVIGARSAVFAPLVDPGLIIIDEEHDGGYKQDEGLRYNGRDLGILRGNLQNSTVLLGSATPSAVSYYNATLGKYSLLEMTSRVHEREMPKVTIVDISKKTNKATSIFSKKLLAGLEDTFKQGQQSLLLLNRRGFATTVLCNECGEAIRCLHCKISLTYHRHKKQMICHYCGYSKAIIKLCPSCEKGKLIPVGFGTEKVEKELKKIIPDAIIERLDSDTARDRRYYLGVLSKMRRGEIDILIGTQMIAKGHHFPGVTMVGVVWADGGLSIPDYKSSERTYHLISQVTGRAGRGDLAGRVIVQTMNPNHYSIALAKNNQYTELYNKELLIRKNPVFPPYVRLVSICIQGKSESSVQSSATRLATSCRDLSKKNQNIIILGPAPAPIEKLKDNYRWQVLIKSNDLTEMHALCDKILTSKNITTGGAKLQIDIDPENMM